MTGCPIRKSADQRSFAPPRSLSQLVTSFIACESLGIRHTPLSTFACLRHISQYIKLQKSDAYHICTGLLILSAVHSYLKKRNLFQIKHTFTLLSLPTCQRSLGYRTMVCGLKARKICPWSVSCVENNGFEPLTPCLQSRCSSQLS